MAWWKRFLGRREPDPNARPELRDGELVGGEKHGVWVEQDGSRRVEIEYRAGVRHGRYRRWRGTGELLEEGSYADGERDGPFVIYGPGGGVQRRGAYEAGVLQDGIVERYDEARPDWLRERGPVRGGERDGIWEELFAEGGLAASTAYIAGKKHGPYRRHHRGGARWIEGDHAGDLRYGRWIYRRHDDTVAAEVDHDAAGAIAAWRWLARDGRERAPVAARADDVERWIALGDAWDDAVADGITYGVQLAVDAWPDGERAAPLAWIAAQHPPRPPRWDAGPAWLYAMLEHDDDPRAALIDEIAIDHHTWTADHVAHLVRRAPQLRVLGLDECMIEPGVAALFPPGAAWTRLETLSLHDCGGLAEAVRRIAAEGASWPALRDLYLGGHDDRATAGELAPVLAAPWLDRLTDLGLGVRGDPTPVIDALVARRLPALRKLELRFHEEGFADAARAALAAAYPDAAIDVEG